MNVRDAREADADELAAIADSPTDVMRNLVHDRTVRVAEDGAGARDPNASTGGASTAGSTNGDTPREDLLGFVSFDAREETVHVTQIDGTTDACERLLAEPVRFAENEDMAVEVLVPKDQQPVTDAAQNLGFDQRGSGPRFAGTQTVRFRLEPS